MVAGDPSACGVCHTVSLLGASRWSSRGLMDDHFQASFAALGLGRSLMNRAAVRRGRSLTVLPQKNHRELGRLSDVFAPGAGAGTVRFPAQVWLLRFHQQNALPHRRHRRIRIHTQRRSGVTRATLLTMTASWRRICGASTRAFRSPGDEVGATISGRARIAKLAAAVRRDFALLLSTL